MAFNISFFRNLFALSFGLLFLHFGFYLKRAESCFTTSWYSDANVYKVKTKREKEQNVFQISKNYPFGVASRPLPGLRVSCSRRPAGTIGLTPRPVPPPLTVSEAESTDSRSFNRNRLPRCKKDPFPGTSETLTSETERARKLSARNLPPIGPSPICSGIDP